MTLSMPALLRLPTDKNENIDSVSILQWIHKKPVKLVFLSKKRPFILILYLIDSCTCQSKLEKHSRPIEDKCSKGICEENFNDLETKVITITENNRDQLNSKDSIDIGLREIIILSRIVNFKNILNKNFSFFNKLKLKEKKLFWNCGMLLDICVIDFKCPKKIII
ncbi:hypothetical protein BpHYR1_017740 [Brachionus plicatilis]|uniref:Uncharacterized protein n=1 Tax=Brachionus plicatilis TaxID=10195 RepID=A0A3M7S6S8_BRAPC|nr:hypothetical protein BpHYR1_017740 [Brachionus plicatilis]